MNRKNIYEIYIYIFFFCFVTMIFFSLSIKKSLMILNFRRLVYTAFKNPMMLSDDICFGKIKSMSISTTTFNFSTFSEELQFLKRDHSIREVYEIKIIAKELRSEQPLP